MYRKNRTINGQYKILLFIFSISLFVIAKDKAVRIQSNSHSAIISYGTVKLEKQLNKSGYSVKDSGTSDISYYIYISGPEAEGHMERPVNIAKSSWNIKNDGFKIAKNKNNIRVIGKTERGCLYGIMDLVVQLENGTELNNIVDKHIDPPFSFRAIKFNLPWSPYRKGPATELHMEICRDLKFWEAFLDMMVRNRFNALSLWNRHPFPYMIRAKNFPKATPFNDQELNEWQTFWKTLFKMAKNRGIETFLLNWNIVVSPEFARAYGVKEYFDRSERVKRYTRESVTQLINEYENLSGLGITLADWMGNWSEEKMTPAEREEWISETFVAGMADAGRKIKFIHRAVLAADPQEMRHVIDKANLPDKTIVEVKFNWSHGHSTPRLSLTHANDDGTIMKGFWAPKPENYFIAWMIRNEDFFVLRWGDPEFIRKHIHMNSHEYVDGYFVGSEGYIPAKDYSYFENHPHKTWRYAFEKQWLFYHLWGQLLFNPAETDEALAMEFNKRYPNVKAPDLLQAYTLASKVPEYIASFYKGTWDFTLYSEGFMAVAANAFSDGKSPFISIEELIKHPTLDSRYLTVIDYVDKLEKNVAFSNDIITPVQLARKINAQCSKALEIVEDLKSVNNKPALDSELDDIITWCYLGFYFADKLRAAVALQKFNINKHKKFRQEAVLLLEKCLEHWQGVLRFTTDRYKKMPYVSMGHDEPQWANALDNFHWSNFLEDVKEDIEYAKQMQPGN